MMEDFAVPSPEGAASCSVSGKGARRRKPVRLPAAGTSEMLLIRIAPRDTGLFRYLLEGGGEHLAMLTVLDPRNALFKLLFSPHQREELLALLEGMKAAVPFEVRAWPFPAQDARAGEKRRETPSASQGREPFQSPTENT